MAARKTGSGKPSAARCNVVRLFDNALGCYMVKPHGQLVQVSFTRYRASTPCLSTS